MPLLEQLKTPSGLQVRFQPIVELARGRVLPHGVECLVRGPQGSTVEAAPILFDYVRNKRAEAMVDRLCVARGMSALAAAKPDGWEEVNLHLNVHCVTLARDPGFAEFLLEAGGACGLESSALTVELLEYREFSGSRELRRSVDALHAHGVRIALDDIGHADSNLRMLLDSQADYFKIDGYFVRGVSRDIYRQALVRSLVELAPSFGAWVVAEGLEEPDDLETLAALGVGFVQGFLVSAPCTAEELGSRLVERPASTLGRTDGGAR